MPLTYATLTARLPAAIELEISATRSFTLMRLHLLCYAYAVSVIYFTVLFTYDVCLFHALTPAFAMMSLLIRYVYVYIIVEAPPLASFISFCALLIELHC